MNAVEGSANLRALYIVWWYKEVSASLFRFIKHFFVYLLDLFSVKVCFLTLFAPWKRDSISTEGLGIQDRFQVMMLNLASRLIGAVIKLGTIVTFAIFSILFTIIFLFSILIWLFYPVLIVLFVVYGIKIILTS